MTFPGNNELKLSSAAVKAIIVNHLRAKFGDDVRITDVTRDSYGSGVTVDFTTDPEKLPTPIAPAPITDPIFEPASDAEGGPL